MKDSQYVNYYLSENSRRGINKGVTIGTYLSFNLKGEAKRWIGRYEGALQRSLDRLVKNGSVIKGRSIHNSVAYYASEDNTK